MGERDARERFARAVDSVDGESTQSDDHEFGAELAIVRDLQRAGTVPVSDQRTRHNVAVRFSEKIAEPARTENLGTPEPAPARRRRRRMRPALAAAFCLLAGLCGLTLLLSQNALPGDPLYSVKRARESAVLALTFDKQEKAQRLLTYAADRIDELAELAAHESDSTELAAAYAAGLDAFDDAVRTASVKLTSMAAGTDGEQLETLRTWSAQQAGELAALPPAGARQQVSSVALLERVEHRAAALRERFDCYRITSGVTDQLGAIPATGTCVPPMRQPSERQAPPPAPAPPSTAPRTPAGTLVSSPVTARSAAQATPERGAKPEATRAQDVTTARTPARFEPAPPVPAPPPIDRPRAPSDTGDAPPSADEVVRDLVGDVVDTPLGE